ncbi:GvpL/GvpF family gas vesicle protein [Streptomyces sp. NPDC051976]|uniref:GvpL/GvpF family gas vesicle protein n=1 Tax=Streptomyces sp. NPDC051976 TaxID=3154947 RepID=UPI003436EFD5
MEPTAEDARAEAREDAAEELHDACYVYGIVALSDTGHDAESTVGQLPAVGGDPEARVEFVRHGDIAAAVSSLSTDRPLGRPEDLRAHAGVLNPLAASGAPVLPFRFGTVVADTRAVTDDVLARGHDTFVKALQRLKGRAQFTLRAVYEQDSVLREVLRERPDIVELRETVAGLPEDAAYYERVRLGELVAESLAMRQQKDTEDIERQLSPLADALVVSSAPAAEDAVADISLLVSDDRRAEFERTANDMARRWHGRIRMRLLGPLAPYDFVAEAMEGSEGVP